jgi:ubiquitin C-terminal hydrolase
MNASGSMETLDLGANATQVPKQQPSSTAVVVKSFSGLANQGATCYMNSLLQTLCVVLFLSVARLGSAAV